jgi:hypothetical protein
MATVQKDNLGYKSAITRGDQKRAEGNGKAASWEGVSSYAEGLGESCAEINFSDAEFMQ